MELFKASGNDGFLVDRWLTVIRLLLLAAAALTTVNARSDQIQNHHQQQPQQQQQQQQQQQIVKKLAAPAIIDPRSEKLVLNCEYDLHGKELYSVNWYKYDKTLFRYMPSMQPKGTAFQQDPDDVSIDIEDSFGKKLTLLGHNDIRKNMKAYEGTYTCEVAMEQTFHAAFAVANVSSAILPQSDPVLEGLNSHYQVGEYLNAVCTTAPSLPPAEITFYLNRHKVEAPYITYNKKFHPIGESSVAPSQASISIRLDRKHFSDGTLTVTCKATLPGIHAAPEYKREQRATLGASNQRLAQELPRLFSSGSSELKISMVVLLIEMIAWRL